MLVVPAHAKVNLALEVTGRRPDGWHDVATIIAAVDWHDLVGIRLARRGPGEPAVTLHLSGPFAEGVPSDERNLAHRAATRLLDLAGAPPHTGMDVWVAKQVPVAAGMGGGSADAAAVVTAAARLLAEINPEPRIDTAALDTLAADLGSDVPALLAGGTLLASGRGERIRPIHSPSLHLAVAVAGPSQTAAAYAALDDAERRADGRVDRLVTALAGLPDDALLGSALEPAACRAAPGLADALARLRALTPGRRWHLTGSGGAAFALARDRHDAQALAGTAQAAGFPARACRTLPR